MHIEILSFSIAAIALLASPGPATLALAASGAAYGLKNSFSFYLGITSGSAIALAAVSGGLYLVIRNSATLTTLLMALSLIYLLYICYRVATAPPVRDDPSDLSPGFVAGLLLGSTNIKAYAVFAALLASVPIGMDARWEQWLKALICLLTCVVFDGCWLYAGSRLRRLFINPTSSRVLNISFAILIIGAVGYSLTLSE